MKIKLWNRVETKLESKWISVFFLRYCKTLQIFWIGRPWLDSLTSFYSIPSIMKSSKIQFSKFIQSFIWQISIHNRCHFWKLIEHKSILIPICLLLISKIIPNNFCTKKWEKSQINRLNSIIEPTYATIIQHIFQVVAQFVHKWMRKNYNISVFLRRTVFLWMDFYWKAWSENWHLLVTSYFLWSGWP